MKRGKEFENEIKNSLRYYKDVEKNVMFSKNELLGGKFHFHEDLLPDFFVFTDRGIFWLLECKKIQNKNSFPFWLLKKHQIKDLRRVSKWPNGKGVVLLNFRSPKKSEEKWNEVFAIPIRKFIKYVKSTDRKSLKRSWVQENCMRLEKRKFEVPKTKKEGTVKISGWDIGKLLFKKED